MLPELTFDNAILFVDTFFKVIEYDEVTLENVDVVAKIFAK